MSKLLLGCNGGTSPLSICPIAEDLTEGLIASYLLNNNSNDNYGVYNGSDVNAPDYKGDTALFSYTGVNDDSTMSYIDTGIDRTTAGFVQTASMYVRANTLATTNYLYCEGYTYELSLLSTGRVFARIYGELGGVVAEVFSDVGTIVIGESYHIAVAFTTRTVRLWLDSVEIGYDDGTGGVDTAFDSQGNPDILIGRHMHASLYFGNSCNISNVRIYEDIKDQAFVDKLNAEGYYPKPLNLVKPTIDGLMAHYRLTGTAEDETGNYDGIESGNTYINSAEFGSVAKFDAIDNYIELPLPTNIRTVSIWFEYRVGEEQFINLVLANDRRFVATVNSVRGTLYDIVAGTEDSGLLAPDYYGVNGLVLGKIYLLTATLTIDGFVSGIYINGVKLLGGTDGLSRIHPTSILNRLGAREAIAFPYGGALKDCRLYDRETTQQEITDIYKYEKNFRPIDIDDGLVAFYPLGKNSLDNYYNEFDGVDTAMTYDGLSGVFNGSSNVATVACANILSGDITFSVWAKLDAVAVAPNFIVSQMGLADDGRTTRAIYFSTSNNVVMLSRDSGGVAHSVSKAFDSGGQLIYSHIVGIDRGTTTELYVDGVFIGSIERSTNYTFLAGLNFGSRVHLADTDTYFLDGNIAKGRIFNKALSAEQVQAIYCNEKGDFI